MIVEKLEEIGIQLLEINLPYSNQSIPRYSTDPNATVEDHLEWIKSEFEQLSLQTVELKENSIRFRKKVDRECDKIMEEMERRRERCNRAITDCLRLAEQRAEERLKRLCSNYFIKEQSTFQRFSGRIT